jgi:translation initiation factor IF-1
MSIYSRVRLKGGDAFHVIPCDTDDARGDVMAVRTDALYAKGIPVV